MSNDFARGYHSNLENLSQDDINVILSRAFERYYETSGLLGTVSTCLPMVERFKEVGVDEVACLIDFGVDTDEVLASLHALAKLKDESNVHKTLEPLAAHIKRLGVTHMQCTPSQASMLLFAPECQSTLDSVQRLLLGGEALPLALLRQLGELVSGEIHNMYGPTETTIWSTTQLVKKGTDTIAIGRPIANTQVYILDKHLQLQPIGVTGELFIAGQGVARGYLHQPALTAQRFLPDPWSTEAGALLYRTGDEARYLADGSIEYLGRTDQQIKLRGYRIELGEIEAVLRQHEKVADCVVLVREDVPEQKRLVAYPVVRQGYTLTTSELRSYLRDRLPAYMRSAACMPLSTLPLTPNGKLDRRALPVPKEVEHEESTAQAWSRTPIEELLIGLWKEV